jgi:drug/metabolite transporter (DMT)-like permease
LHCCDRNLWPTACGAISAGAVLLFDFPGEGIQLFRLAGGALVFSGIAIMNRSPGAR